MGGPEVSAYTCMVQCEQLIERLKERAASPGLNPEVRADLYQTIAEVAGLQVLATESRAEITRLAEAYPLPSSPPTNHGMADQLVCAMMVAAADKGFRSLDNFVGWLVAGAGAGVALIVANIDKVQHYVPTLDARAVLIRIGIALALVVVAKFFGSLICAASGAMDRMFEVLDGWEKRGWSIPDGAAFAAAREQTMPWLMRLYPRGLTSRPPTRIARRALGQLMIAGLSSLAAIGLVAWTLFDIGLALA